MAFRAFSNRIPVDSGAGFRLVPWLGSGLSASSAVMAVALAASSACRSARTRRWRGRTDCRWLALTASVRAGFPTLISHGPEPARRRAGSASGVL